MLKRRYWMGGAVLLVGIVLAIYLFTRPPAGQDGVRRATLDNGMQVVVIRNALAPVVTTQINYRVGSNAAPRGFPGTAHALEHMMFRGSPGLSRAQLTQIGALLGGNFNAATTQTVTRYYYTAPAAQLGVILHVEAARMRGLNVTPADWENERGAIEQEVVRDLSNPEYKFYKQLLATMFKGTPYAHDALGTRASFEATTAAMLKQFHQQWYVPNNATLVIVGDVDPQAVLTKVRKLFGDIPRAELPPRPAIQLQPVKAQTLHLNTDRGYGMNLIAYRMPGMRSADHAASVILADVISSRRGHFNALVPEGKALAASFSLNSFRDTGIGFAMGVFPKGGDAQALLAAMQQRLAQIRSKGVDKALVAAAKRQEIARIEQRKNSIAGLAQLWSDALVYRGLQSPAAMKQALQAVTVADVNRLARQVLNPAYAITAILTPRPSGQPKAASGFGGAESFAAPVGKPVALPAWARSLTQPPPSLPAQLQPTVSQLDNGLTLIVQPSSISDSVSVYGSIHSVPALQTPKGQEGVAQVLAGLFAYGGGPLDRSAYQKALDAIAAQHSGGRQFAIVTPAQHLDRALQLLALNTLQPRLQAQNFATVRKQTAAAIAGQLQSPDYLFQRSLHKALLPADDPILRQATDKTVLALQLADVKAYYHKVFRPDLATLVIIGKVTPAHAQALVRKHFGDWQASGATPQLQLPTVPDNPASLHAVPDRSARQASVALAQTLQLSVHDPAHYALNLGNAVLSGGFYASRLYRDLRANSGLVYTLASQFDFGRNRSTYTLRYGCDTDNIARARSIALRDLAQMQTEPVPKAELNRARNMLLRQLPMSRASVAAIARGWLYYAQHELPLDQPRIVAKHLRALSAADVQRAFAKWLRLDDLAQVVKLPSGH